LQAHFRVAHVAFDLGLGGECRTVSMTMMSIALERISESAISSACSPLSGCVDEQVVDVHAEFLCVETVERMRGVDEGCDAARLLRLGDRMDRQRRLARRFGAVDLDDTPFGIAAHAERHVERDRPRGNDRHVDDLAAVHAHDRPFAEILFDFVHDRAKHFELVRVCLWFFCHIVRCYSACL